MDNYLFVSYKIEDRSYVSFIKREIHNLVKEAFGPVRTAEIDIVVSELTSNIIKHAKKGELLYRLSSEDDLPLLEIICIDEGPGIKDISHSMRDGISSTNTLGQGIGSVTRLSNVAQFYSAPDWGTIVYCRFHPLLTQKSKTEKYLLRCLNVAIPGETVSGDGCVIKHTSYGFHLMLGDGLGHGQHAKQAVDDAIDSIRNSMENDPALLLKKISADVKKTRGLVATILKLDNHSGHWEICGVGNITARLYSGIVFNNYMGNNGIVGHNLPGRLENTLYPAERRQQWILCSDGLRSKWDISQYPLILKYDPMMLAACLYKDFCRRTDDVSVLILKSL